MVKKSEENKEVKESTENIPINLRRVFREVGITDDKEIIKALRGK